MSSDSSSEMEMSIEDDFETDDDYELAVLDAFENHYGYNIDCTRATEEVQFETSKLLFQSSLKNKCLNALVNNLRILQSNKDKEPILIKCSQATLSMLAPNLKLMLLKKLRMANYRISMCDDDDNVEIKASRIYDVICKLLGPQILEFNFQWMGDNISPMDSFFYDKDKAYKLLAKKYSKSLLRLIHGNEGIISFRCNYELSFVRLESIMSLTNLQHLQLHDNALNDVDFRRISQKLTDLRYLSCELLDVSQAGLSVALMHLQKLEVFIFKAWTRKLDFGLNSLVEVDTSKFNGFCLIMLPQLKIVGARVGDECFHRNFRTTSLHLKPSYLSTGKPAGLQHLSIKSPLTVEQAQRLPHVTSLRVSLGDQFKSNMETLLKFDKLRSLTVEWPPENFTYDKNLLLQLLKVYGSQIESLTLITHPHYQELGLEEIHGICPNLQNLSLDHDFTRGFDKNTLLNPSTINNLTKISITGWDESWNIKMLFQLFSPPMLECLCLWKVGLLEETLLDLLKNQKVPENISPRLRELRGSVNFSDEWFSVHDVEMWKIQDYAEWWNFFVDLICARAPALIYVDFHEADSNLVLDTKTYAAMKKRARVL